MIDLSAKLEDLIQLADLPCALALNARRRSLDELDRLAPLSFGERGQIALTFEERALWQYVDCHSFDHWMNTGSEIGRSTMYAAYRAAKELAGDVDDLTEIPRGNVETLRQMSSAVRSDPEVQQAAKTMAPAQFTEHIEEHHPDQHIESRKIMKFSMTKSAAFELERAIKYAIDYEGAASREEALLAMAIEALHQWELEDEVEAMSLENGHDGDEIDCPRLLQ